LVGSLASIDAAPNKRLERTRHERASLLSNLGEPLKRSVGLPPWCYGQTALHSHTVNQEILIMHNEEIERKMNFIVEQQAQFASDIQQLQESQARTEKVVVQTSETVAVTAETMAQMGEIVTRLANVTHVGFTEVNAKLNALVDAQIRTEENVARTNESLTNLIAVVDRRFREEDRNGSNA
jgi:hypothetical protein